MIPENRVPTHPGKTLLEEYLSPLRLTQVVLAQHLSVPTQHINKIVCGPRGITPETAWLLSQAFRTTPQSWLDLQSQRYLALSRPKHEIESPTVAA